MMRLTLHSNAVRPTTALALPPPVRGPFVQRRYATQGQGTAGPRRKAVTPFNDDGHVPWSELSAGEKAARATQQTFNYGFVLVGLALTGGVGYLLYADVFSYDSKTNHFNRVVERIRRDPRCVEVLGDGKKLAAHGDETWNRWRRARPIASSSKVDAQGNEHLMMRFYVEGPKDKGVVSAHLIKRHGGDEFRYKYLFLDVTGHQRIYLENAEASGPGGAKSASRNGLKLFGINWG